MNTLFLQWYIQFGKPTLFEKDFVFGHFVDWLEPSRGMILIYLPSSAKCCSLVATLGDYNGYAPKISGYDFQQEEFGLVTNSNDDSLGQQTKPTNTQGYRNTTKSLVGCSKITSNSLVQQRITKQGTSLSLKTHAQELPQEQEI